MTNGMPRVWSWLRIDSLRSEKTAITPVGRRARTPSIQPRPGGPPPMHLGQDDRQVLLARDPFDAADDLERPFTVELVEDQLEDRGRPRGAVGSR